MHKKMNLVKIDLASLDSKFMHYKTLFTINWYFIKLLRIFLKSEFWHWKIYNMVQIDESASYSILL